MKIEYSLGFEDMALFGQHQKQRLSNAIKPRIRTPKTRAVMGLTGGVCAGLLTAAVVFGGRPWIVLPALVAVVFICVVVDRWYRKTYSQIVFSEEFARLTVGRRVLQADTEYVSENTFLREIQLRWSGVEEIASTPTHLFIYWNKLNGIILPKRAFQDEAAALAFENELRVHWEAGKNPPAV